MEKVEYDGTVATFKGPEYGVVIINWLNRCREALLSNIEFLVRWALMLQ